MSFLAVFLLAATAVAADVGKCGDPGAAACPALGVSLFQSASLVLSKQQIKREEDRHKLMVEDAVERRLLVLGGLLLEGMTSADAVSLHQSLATELAEELKEMSVNDLKSNSSVPELVQQAGKPIHRMICHIQENEEDCESEWSELVRDAVEANLRIFSGLGSSLLQFLTGSVEKKAAVANIEVGETNAELLKLLKETVVKGLKIFVRIGECPESMLLVARDTMTALKNLNSTMLLRFSGHTKLDLVTRLHVSLLHSVCRAAPHSCVDVVVPMITKTEDIQDTQKENSLLEIALRPAVRVVLKLLDIPEFPEETAAKRAEASRAYLKQRRLFEE